MGASHTLPSGDPEALADLAAAALERDSAEWFAALNPDFGVLLDGREPRQHRFAADREQALALGTRAIEALRAHNHEDPDQRQRAITGADVEAELDGVDLLAHRPILERTRGGPER